MAYAIHLYVVASWWGWSQGDSFGGRVFLNAFWAWALGLSAVFTWGAERRGRVLAMGVLCAVLIGWNALSLVQYRLGFIAAGRQPTIRDMTVGRLEVPSQVLAWMRRRN